MLSTRLRCLHTLAGRCMALPFRQRSSTAAVVNEFKGKGNASGLETDVPVARIKPDGPVAPSRDRQYAKNPIVAAAFAALNSPDDVSSSSKSGKGYPSLLPIDDLIVKANGVDDLLKISDKHQLERTQALKIVSVIAEWQAKDRIKLEEFENDGRFIRLCKILGKASNRENAPQNNGPMKRTRSSGASGASQSYRNEDLNTVLSVTGDDEAAKLISNINLAQMVKIMSSLAQKRRRSVPLLRSLAMNITGKSEQIDAKKCADILYAMATLNFYDANLMSRVCLDFQKAMPTIDLTKSSAVIGSMCTSLGLIKYRDPAFMDILGKWLLQQRTNARPQDISAFVLSSAILNLRTSLSDDLKKEMPSLLVREDFVKAVDYLNHVWALTLLGWSSTAQMQSLFNQVFVNKLFQEARQNTSLVQSVKMKLLNVSAAAKHLMGDQGMTASVELGESFDMDWGTLSKSKQLLVGSLMDTLNTLLPTQKNSPATDLIRTHYDTKMGFYVDAICVLDAKGNRISVDSADVKATRIAMMTLDYHDYCQSTSQDKIVTGILDFTFRLLERNGYSILEVPYTEFSVNEKLLKRVQFLEGRLKRVSNVNRSEKSNESG